MKDSIDIKRLQAPKNEKNCRKQLVPPWLNVINNTVFFNTCILHPDTKKNELDHFCIDCLRSLCSNCLPAHMCHKHIKIRRYIYSDVINRQDLCKLFNCSGIQTYHTNKAKVVFLKQRRQSVEKQQYNNYNNSKEYRCAICDRTLQENSRYCSIACKVLALHGEAISMQDDDDTQQQYLPKRPKLKRKGVPLRSPMF